MIAITVEVYVWVALLDEEPDYYGWRLFASPNLLMVTSREMYRDAGTAAVKGFEAANRIKAAFEEAL